MPSNSKAGRNQHDHTKHTIQHQASKQANPPPLPPFPPHPPQLHAMRVPSPPIVPRARTERKRTNPLMDIAFLVDRPAPCPEPAAAAACGRSCVESPNSALHQHHRLDLAAMLPRKDAQGDHHQHHHHRHHQPPPPLPPAQAAPASHKSTLHVEQGEPKLNGPPLANGAMLVRHHDQAVLIFVCRLCAASFGAEADLFAHEKSVHAHELDPKSPFRVRASAAATSGGDCQWPGCTKHFKRSDQLMLHVRTHTNERPHKCTTCGRGFAQSGDLVRHERTHSGEAPYTCAMCNKKFRTSNALRRHDMVHTGMKVHRCVWPGCEAEFLQKRELKAHIHVHVQQRSYHV